ncbi:SGNH hydrolase-type esterase domain-containing protein [Protomyces lactucae-debilis]|uniref:SGNH hydrolase-type esterase domain-containing protein n=1 Tax=Protomyces lactucae-debilis TaxID=2754530 RepID=A0A1Y2FV82_PROLT|nr:SGNH hydrolase-type esterase domain-containing protein [Protomyces lactucae-debilis]ORY87902.1 SGNH hydrolase-type esterase domain-containing protein [Protomyces lactucae-debilis]
MLGRNRIVFAAVTATFIASTGFLFSPHGRPLYHATINKLQPYTDAVTRPWTSKQRVWPATCSERPYRVLAVGDSLTAGWVPPPEGQQPITNPYTDQFSKIVRHALHTKNIGFTGYKADEMHQVMLDEIRLQDEPFDIFITMGGTNDILERAPEEAFDPAPVIETLKQTWTTALSHGNDTLLVVLNLLDIAYDPYLDRVLQLNALLPEAVASLNSSRVFLMDLHAQFTMLGKPAEEVKENWADPVHPSENGYNIMGQLIAKQLDTLISC